MDLTEKAKEILNQVEGFITNNNYNIVKVEDHYCELEGIITGTSKNHLDIAHGGYIFGLADTCAGIAAMTDFRMGVTIDSSISFLKQAKGHKLLATAKPLSVGKRISVFEVFITDEEDSLIAKATMTYSYINKTFNNS